MWSLCAFQRQPAQLLIKTHRPGAVSLHVRFLLLWDSFLAASCPTLRCAKCGFHPRHLNFFRTSPQTRLALHAQVGAGCPWAAGVSFLSGRSGSVPIICGGSPRIMVGLFGARFCSWIAVLPSYSWSRGSAPLCSAQGLACSAWLVPVRKGVCASSFKELESPVNPVEDIFLKRNKSLGILYLVGNKRWPVLFPTQMCVLCPCFRMAFWREV